MSICSSRSAARISLRLPTLSRISTPGSRRMKAASARGAKYLAVLITPTATRPPCMPRKRGDGGAAIRQRRLDAGDAPPAPRARRRSPACRPACARPAAPPAPPPAGASCWLTAGGVTASASAAADTVPVRTTARQGAQLAQRDAAEGGIKFFFHRRPTINEFSFFPNPPIWRSTGPQGLPRRGAARQRGGAIGRVPEQGAVAP